MSDGSHLDSARTACDAIAHSADTSLPWEWDGRFGTAMAAFGADQLPVVQGVLGPHFQHTWSAAEIGKAPERVTALAGRLGGLRGGQVLWVSAAEADVMLFCAWWPWGDGARISIRIGCDGPDATEDDLKSWFGL